jgi:hypothetical protein
MKKIIIALAMLAIPTAALADDKESVFISVSIARAEALQPVAEMVCKAAMDQDKPGDWVEAKGKELGLNMNERAFLITDCLFYFKGRVDESQRQKELQSL